MTPAQAKDNIELYALSNPVDERIQTAVQRFCARRKFDSGLKEVFDRYLVFGGIDAGPNMFGGGDDPDAGDLTAQEIAALKNTKFLNEAVVHGDMVVDFDGVLKAYLLVTFFSGVRAG
jgi:Argonaute siRNA chaperone (ARC) complex subunit Arb1